MRVKIGPHRNDLISLKNLEWRYEIWRSDSFYLDDRDYKWYDKLVMGFFDKFHDLVLPINRWWCNRPRKIKVHVDYYDVWSADHTLALIISPVLKKLKECKHGYPHVDEKDVPKHLRMTKKDRENLEYDGTVDAKHEARWIWVLDEMIWTFDQFAATDDTDQFSHNIDQLEMVSVPSEDIPGYSTLSFNYQKDPNKEPYWVDEEGKKKHHERKQNGLRLFAKYYQNLWD